MKELLFIVCLMAMLFLTEATLPRSSLNNYCDQFNRCDSKAALKCENNRCQCVRPEAMIFDKESSKCLVISGERCSYTAVEMASNKQVRKWTEQVDCVNNADCSSDGYCNCRSNFMEARNGTCIPKILFGGYCSSNSQCRGDKHLVCIRGKCSCNRTSMAYSELQEKCVTLAGKVPLEKDRSCVENAHYNQNYYNNRIDYQNCACNSGFVKSKDGLCLVPFAGACGSTVQSQCDRSMICKNGKCACRYLKQKATTLDGVYHCISKVNQPCKVTLPETHFLEEKGQPRIVSYNCTKNAECLLLGEIYECRCKRGYVEVDGECQLDHGETCKIGTTEKCDEIRGLQCIDSKCQCPIDNLNYFDEDIKNFRGLVGAVCNITGNAADYNRFCTPGATCEPNRNITSGRGLCRCAGGFFTTPERMCLEIISDDSTLPNVDINVGITATSMPTIENTTVSAIAALLETFRENEVKVIMQADQSIN